MNLIDLSPGWLRGMRRLAYVFVTAAVLAGLVFTWRAAFRADVARAVLGAAATLGMLVAGVLWMASLRVGVALFRVRRRFDRLERRLSSLFAERLEDGRRVQALTGRLDEVRRQLDSAVDDLAARTQADTRRVVERLEGTVARVETFSGLYDDQAERLERRVSVLESALRRGAASADAAVIEDRGWSLPDAPPGERTVAAYHHLVGQETSEDSPAGEDHEAEKRRLRADFAALIHRRDYAAALVKGDELTRRFADSSAAADFRRVRPHLVRRIQLAEGKAVARGGD